MNVTVTVFSVNENSLAERAGIKPEDIIISINGNEINDVLDYRFYMTEKKLTIKIHRGPELFDVKIKKGEYDDIGLEFETYLMDKKASCRNKCIFCFIDQLPPDMRDSLYFKDDDSRMSFLSGNYITLTNLSGNDIDRIIKFRMSPINISVHTSDPQLRCKMMNNRFAGESLKYIEKLSENGIEMNCQIVLCRGVNDKEKLSETMEYLEKLYPQVSSVSVVPSGLTKYREGLFPLSPYGKDECEEIIRQVDSFGSKCLKKHGQRIFYCSDELYIKAKKELPGEEYYEGYPQIENGVGLMRSLLSEFYDELKHTEEYDTETSRRFSAATGALAYGYIKSMLEELKKKCRSLEFNIYKIENNFFGKEITVAGLLTGKDIYEQLKGKDLGDILFLPVSTLRHERDMFLDSMTPDELSKLLGTEIRFVENDGYKFISSILYTK